MHEHHPNVGSGERRFTLNHSCATSSPSPAFPSPDPDRYALIYDHRDGRILENRRVLPRFYAVRNVLIEFRPEVFYPQVQAHREWANTALLDNFPKNAVVARMRDDFFRPRPQNAPLAQAKIVEASPTDYKLNAVFLGFAVPPGHHDVRVWYAPLSFWGGLAIAVLTLIGLVMWWRRSELRF